ncbi:MAG: hypothetical protein JWO13_1041 [Acidobacteriales bacterium]|nr:hypothetical protein [Terriglobales bacterium]
MLLRKNNLAFGGAIFAMAMASGCHKQPKPMPIVPAPTFPLSAIMLEIQPLPPPGVAAAPPPPPIVVAKVPARTTRPRPKQRVPERSVTTTPVIPPTNGGSSTPTVTRSYPPPRITGPITGGSDSAANIYPGMAHSDELHHRLTTAQLVQSTEDNVRSLTRKLTQDDKSVLEQIKSFLAQSRSATAENDLVRAHNLALKAHLLSDELARP